MKYIIGFVSLSAAVAFIAGCASTGYDKAEDTSTSLQQTAKRIDQGNAQIDIVLTNLSALVNSPNEHLKPQYKKFNSAMNDLESLVKNVGDDANDMQTEGVAYFDKWDEELAKIHNEDIRSRSEERERLMSEQFDQVEADYLHTRNDFTPFMSDLEDIRTALAVDLTAGGLDSIRDEVTKANQDSAPVRQSLNNLSASFKELGVSLSAKVERP
jgi:hypothetical protein